MFRMSFVVSRTRWVTVGARVRDGFEHGAAAHNAGAADDGGAEVGEDDGATTKADVDDNSKDGADSGAAGHIRAAAAGPAATTSWLTESMAT